VAAAGAGWFSGPGAVVPPTQPPALPVPVDRGVAEIVSLKVLGDPLSSESWFESLP
jgi:hypothetical protein